MQHANTGVNRVPSVIGSLDVNTLCSAPTGPPGCDVCGYTPPPRSSLCSFGMSTLLMKSCARHMRSADVLSKVEAYCMCTHIIYDPQVDC